MTDIDDIVFSQTQIARGMRPLAQHGTVVVGADKSFSMYGTNGELIAQAPVDQVSAKRGVWPWRNMVFLNVAGRKYNCTPGWGENRWNGAVGMMRTSAAKGLVDAVVSGGQRTAT